MREKGKKHNKMRKLRERERERGRTKKEAGGMIKKEKQRGQVQSVERDESDAGGCLGR